ncbi:MAG: peptide deformylase [Eubacteriales bacterium]|jgi:peptide deformylase
MIRDINRDPIFLSQKSEPAGKEDLQTARDLLDTLQANRDRCVGMAANMIGVKKNIIVVNIGPADMVMFNPVITRKNGAYEAEEGCLSLSGTRKTTRYREIEVDYEDMNLKKHHQKFSGFPAQIIQHEMDHLQGILI